VSAYSGDTPTSEDRSDTRDLFSFPNDVVRWTNVLAIEQGKLYFAIKDGTSLSWGEFGGPEYLLQMPAGSLEDLRWYTPRQSVDAAFYSVDIRHRRTSDHNTVERNNDAPRVHQLVERKRQWDESLGSLRSLRFSSLVRRIHVSPASILPIGLAFHATTFACSERATAILSFRRAKGDAADRGLDLLLWCCR